MEKAYRLTFDFGSGSVKTVLSDRMQNVVGNCSVSYETYYPRLGWALQKPETYWMAMQEGIRTVLQQSGVAPIDIAGIAISQTASTIIFVDEEGNALSDCVMWMDGRAEAQAQQINAKLGENRFGGKKVISKLLWFLQNEPELIERSSYMLDVSGYLFHKLTGEFVYEFTCGRSTCLMDVETRQWDDAMFQLIGFPKRLIPARLVDSTGLVGCVTDAAAKALGLVAGIPVFGGCSDHATAHLGTGCIHPGDAHIYIGTSAWLQVTTSAEKMGRGQMPSPVPDLWYHFYDTDTGGACLDYLISTFYAKELEAGMDAFRTMNEEIKSVQERGNDEKLIFLPFLTGASAPISNTAFRAALLNLKRNTTRRHISRAVMEGVCFNLRWMRDIHVEKNGWNVNFLRGIGGGMQSSVFAQTLADVLQFPITPLKNSRFAGNLGLAACIDVGLGLLPGLWAIDNNICVDETVQPRPETAARYDHMYQMYRKSYYALSDIYQELNGN